MAARPFRAPPWPTNQKPPSRAPEPSVQAAGPGPPDHGRAALRPANAATAKGCAGTEPEARVGTLHESMPAGRILMHACA